MKYKHLIQTHRYYIYVERQKGSTQKSIADAIGVSSSTVSREQRRNGGRHSSYNFLKARRKADGRSRRSAVNHAVRWRARELLTSQQWSPRQISGRLRMEELSISHETIYAMIRADLTGELASHCRHGMRMLMEKLRYGEQAAPLARVAWRRLSYKGEGLKTITTDNGSEFAEHQWLVERLAVSIYFTDSYASWQKGNIENTNKLIRQYIPKVTDINKLTDKRIKAI